MFFVSQSPDLLLQRNWNHMYVKADHRMSADLISVTWWRGWSGWLSWWFLTSLGFSRSLKDPQTNKKSTSQELAKLYTRLFLSKFLMNFWEILIHAVVSTVSITEEILDLVLLSGRPQSVSEPLENLFLILPQSETTMGAFCDFSGCSYRMLLQFPAEECSARSDLPSRGLDCKVNIVEIL